MARIGGGVNRTPDDNIIRARRNRRGRSRNPFLIFRRRLRWANPRRHEQKIRAQFAPQFARLFAGGDNPGAARIARPPRPREREFLRIGFGEARRAQIGGGERSQNRHRQNLRLAAMLDRRLHRLLFGVNGQKIRAQIGDSRGRPRRRARDIVQFQIGENGETALFDFARQIRAASGREKFQPDFINIRGVADSIDKRQRRFFVGDIEGDDESRFLHFPPFYRNGIIASMTTTAKMMRAVWLSMIPAAGAAAFRFGGGVLWQIALCAAAAVCAEAFCLRLRGALDGRRFFASADFFSALVAALIVALSLPPQAFWAAGAGAALFAVAVAKHCFGGLGANPFNPAMAGVALAVVAFPGEWSEWPAARTGLWESARIVFSNPPPADAVSTATPLTARRLTGATPAWQIDWPFALAVCGGGAFLLWRKIADYRLVAGFCAGAAAAAIVAAWLDENAIPVVAHFAWGGFLFAAFFVVTDPPSAATGRGARWLYAVGAGAAVVWLRENGADADAVAFAILAANALAPAIDRAFAARGG